MASSHLRGANVLVLGATGFIGRWLCQAFNTAGAHVVGVSRNSFPGATPSFQLMLADLAVPGSGARLVERARPDLLVNAAGYGVNPSERDASLAHRVNADLVEELAVAVANSPASASWPGQRMIHIGSAFEYGSVPGTVTEDTPCNPATDYGRTKLEGSRRVATVRDHTGLRAVTARVATVYGPGEHPHRLLPSLIRAADTGETISLTAGDQERDFTFVEDVVEGIARLALCPEVPWPILNLATGRLHSVREFATRARIMLRIPAPQVVFGALPYRMEEVWQGRMDIGRLEQLLGWHPATSIDEGIRRTIEFGLMTENARG